MEQTEIDGRVLSKCALKPGPLHLNSVISGRPRMVCEGIIVSLKLWRSHGSSGGERKGLISGYSKKKQVIKKTEKIIVK